MQAFYFEVKKMEAPKIKSGLDNAISMIDMIYKHKVGNADVIWLNGMLRYWLNRMCEEIRINKTTLIVDEVLTTGDRKSVV